MTKIRPVLLWLLLTGPFLSMGQAAGELKPPLPPLTSGPVTAYSDGRATFTYHRLADWVVPAKKQPSEPSGKGHPVSLPCPTQPQLRQRPC